MRLEVVFSMMLYTGTAGYDEHTSRGLREVGVTKDTRARIALKGGLGITYAGVVSHKRCSNKTHKVLRRVVQFGVPLFFLGGAINNELAHRRAR